MLVVGVSLFFDGHGMKTYKSDIAIEMAVEFWPGVGGFQIIIELRSSTKQQILVGLSFFRDGMKT